MLNHFKGKIRGTFPVDMTVPVSAFLTPGTRKVMEVPDQKKKKILDHGTSGPVPLIHDSS